MTAATIRVILADDHPIVLNGIQALLTEETAIHTVATVRNFAELLNTLGKTEADVVVLDLVGMDTAPLSMVMRLQREYPQFRYAIFSSSVDLAPELIQAGVQSYVAKEDLVAHLVKAIEAAYERKRYLSPVVQRSIERTRAIGQRHQLAPREVEVLRLLEAVQESDSKYTSCLAFTRSAVTSEYGGGHYEQEHIHGSSKRETTNETLCQRLYGRGMGHS